MNIMQGKTSFMGFNAHILKYISVGVLPIIKLNSFGILFGSNLQETFSETKNTHLRGQEYTACIP